ncbi:polysaccharide export protein [Sphingomonas ginkgonis]|uniref:Polysaccharide export protein n=1 Tax=Sphingomonas ginkgonis TaxID=2315330 RepID=A0A3R9WP50_9SPHN|nr:polysaccharide biosynthesis/export family protein [Sphingomonas ginkgonis]RST31003.1 polysaccharide export protein [Sphingomonas ginkgonis]
MLTTLLPSCADKRGGPIPYDVALGKPDAPSLTPLGADYRIAPLDKLAIKVFKQPDLSSDYDVDLLGNISMPLVGELKVIDKTPVEVKDEVTSLLGAKYLVHPEVSVGVKESTRNSVTVDGAVNKSGVIPAFGSVTLIQVIAAAGGLKEDANARRVAVFRQIGGKRQAAAFDLTDIRRGQSPDPQIYPGDIVIVDGSSVKNTQKQILTSLPLLNVFSPLGL